MAWLAAAALGACNGPAEPSWINVAVTPATDQNHHMPAPVALDASGRASIALVGPERALTLATWDQGEWRSEAIAELNDVVGYTHISTSVSLAYGADGAAHVAAATCCVSPEDVTRWVTDASGAWVAESLAPAGFTDVAIASSGELVVSTGRTLLTRAGGGWTTTVIDDAAFGGDAAILATAAAAADDVHLLVLGHADDGVSEVFHVRVRGGEQEVRFLAREVQGADIARDGAGRLHACHSVLSAETLVHGLLYRVGAGDAWADPVVVEESVDDGERHGRCSIAIDDAGAAHIVNGDRYATNASGAWTVTSYDAPGEWAAAPAIAVGADRVHITYRVDDSELRYTFRPTVR